MGISEKLLLVKLSIISTHFVEVTIMIFIEVKMIIIIVGVRIRFS